jgi:hypothetical protein
MSALASLMSYVGPKAEGFVRDQRLLTAIMGPYGSAKTTSCIRKAVFEIPQWLTPGPDGIIRHRGCVVRDTYAQLETNVLNSWFTWFPKTKENWNGREMCQRLRYSLIDATTGQEKLIELEVYFRAMGDQKAEDVLKGMELTWLWLNETDTLNVGVWLFGFGRTGRYPSKKDGGCAWRGVFCDFNAPDIDNWTYDLLVEGNLGLTDEQANDMRAVLGSRFGIGFYRQPGGMSKDPRPENVDNLPEGYYEGLAMAFANQPGHLRRFVHNEFGMVRNGQVVFPEFNDQIHMASERLLPLPELPIIAGIDGGRTPALVFAQQDGSQLRILDELVIFDPSKQNELDRMGPTAFAELAREFVSVAYPRNRFGIGFYDPSCDWGEYDDDGTWIDLFRKNFGGQWKPGGEDGNRLEPRLESVRARLNATPGGRPAVLFSPTCKMLRRGFAGGYVIERIKTSVGGRFRDLPTKTDESHVQDALQYLCLGISKKGRIIDDMDARGAARRAAGPRVEYSKGYFSPSRVQGGR